MPRLYGSRTNASATSPEALWGIFGFGNCTGQAEGIYTWVCFSLLFFAVGFPASVAILCETAKTWRAGAAVTPNDFFMVNLAIMDTVFLLVIPLNVINHLTWKVAAFEIFGNALYALNTCGRPLLMACACLDCYVAVVHPIVYHRRKSLRPRVVMVAVVWTLTLVNGFLYCLNYRLFFNEHSSVFFITAIVIIVICDSFIIRSLLKSDRGRRTVHPQKQRAVHVLLYSLVMSLISYLPPVLLFNVGRHLLSNFNDFMCVIGYPTTLTSTLGSAVMPMLFLYNTGKLNCFKFTCCQW